MTYRILIIFLFFNQFSYSQFRWPDYYDNIINMDLSNFVYTYIQQDELTIKRLDTSNTRRIEYRKCYNHNDTLTFMNINALNNITKTVYFYKSKKIYLISRINYSFQANEYPDSIIKKIDNLDTKYYFKEKFNYSYNSHLKIAVEDYTNDSGISYSIIYQYNNDGFLLEKKKTVNDTIVSDKTVYSYDGDNHLIETSNYDFENNLTLSEKCIYENNLLVNKIVIDYFSNDTINIAYTYDQNNLTSEVKYINNSIALERKIQYDKNNRIIKKEFKDIQNKIDSIIIYKYITDFDFEIEKNINKNITILEKFINNKIVYSKKIIKNNIPEEEFIEYDKWGNLKSKYYKSNFENTATYTCDKYGNEIMFIYDNQLNSSIIKMITYYK